MEIPKPSEDDKQFFRSLIADDPEVEIKPMFGNLGAFVHGNMFAGQPHRRGREPGDPARLPVNVGAAA